MTGRHQNAFGWALGTRDSSRIFFFRIWFIFGLRTMEFSTIKPGVLTKKQNELLSPRSSRVEF